LSPTTANVEAGCDLSSSAERAYRAIRARILAGELTAGTHLKERQLADECGVSRTPVRDALRRLALEHLVEFLPNRGAFVTDWSDEELRSLFEIGAMLESYAAGRAALTATADDIALLRECCQEITAAVAHKGALDLDRFVAGNTRFHRHIREMAGSRYLTAVLEQLIEQRVLFLTAISYDAAALQRSNHDHEQIIRALEAGDGESASALMRAHVLTAYLALGREPLRSGGSPAAQ
jgi:DNA-binding GntR family transcriptional regulator